MILAAAANASWVSPEKNCVASALTCDITLLMAWTSSLLKLPLMETLSRPVEKIAAEAPLPPDDAA